MLTLLLSEVPLGTSCLTALCYGLFMLENEHTKPTRGIEVELIHVVKIVEVFEAYPYISRQTLSSFSLESFLTSRKEGRNPSDKTGSNLRVLCYAVQQQN